MTTPGGNEPRDAGVPLADALRRSEEKYRALFDAVPVGLYRSSADGRVSAANPAMAHMLGFPSVESIIGVPAVDLYQDPAARAALLDRLAREGSVRGVEITLRRPDGGLVQTLVSARATLDDAGRVVQIEGTAQDITARARLEAQLRQAQKMEAVGQLAGGIAHDFNNLLGVIIGYSELLLRDVAAMPAAKHRLTEVKTAAERAAALTRQLLAFGRRQVLQPRVLDVNAVVREAEAMLARLIGEDIDIVADLDPALGTVKADPGQLEQVVVNLAVNSRDAMPQGGMLTIRTRNVELDAAHAQRHPGTAAGAYVALEVADTGHGMAREVLDHVFEPFFTTKELGRGTGLGLATVYGIVTQTGGHLEVESEVGRGTTFRVLLPRADAPARVAPPVASPPRGGETILVIEDAAPLREMVQEILQEAGYAVLSAANANEALATAGAHAGAIALVISDVVMPGLSGPAVAARLRGLRPGIRVLFMSGYPDESIGQRGAALDPSTHFLQKPFTADSLTRKVREVLDQGTGA